MATENSKRDANRVTTLTGVTDDANAEIRNLLVDATTGRLLVSGTVTGGAGDVVGPASSTDNAVVRFDSTTGKLVQNSTVIIGDTGNITGLGTLNTLTLPASNFAGLTDSQTLTNKTISGASNTISNINLASQVTGNLPVTNLNSGTSASAATYWRGDGTWAAPSGTGDVVGPASATDNAIVRFDATTGKLVQDSGVTIDDNNNIVLPTTAPSVTTGIIYKGTVRFIHNFYNRTDFATTGNNTFVGLTSGNLTMGSGATQSYHSSYNTVVGAAAGTGITLGYYATIIGANAGTSMTTAGKNTAIGPFSLSQATTGSNNVCVGSNAGQFSTTAVANNTYVGTNAGVGSSGVTSSSNNVAMGNNAAAALTTGNGFNTFLGAAAGSTVTTGAYNIIIGTGSAGGALAPSAITASNEMNIGGFLFGNTSTKVVGIGLTDATSITAHLHLPASTTTRASLRINSGTAPSAPNDGDVWYDATNFLLRSTTSQTIATDTNTLTLTNKTLTSPTLTTPVLGTPSSGTLTNCTGLPIAGLVASTATAIGVGSIELGHASDTTIARVSAGVISVEGVTVPTISSTSTLTNKTLTSPVINTGISGTAVITVPNGGTGVSSATAYAVLCGGTTSTAAVQSIASVGTSGQVLTSNGAGALPTFQTASGGVASQIIPYYAGTATTSSSAFKVTSDIDGSAMYFAFQTAATTLTIQRLAKLSTTGQYIITHETTLTITASLSGHSVAVVGSYVYLSVIHNSGATKIVRRYDKADLANVTTITVSGTDFDDAHASFGDGTNLYVSDVAAAGDDYTFNKYTISGATITFDSAITYTNAGFGNSVPMVISDGTNVFMVSNISTTNFAVKRYAFTGGAVAATGTTYYMYASAYPNISGGGGVQQAMTMYRSGVIGIVSAHTTESNSAVTGAEMIVNYVDAP